METTVRSRGLDHIAIKIFNYLDAEELLNCMSVSKSWNNCINTNRTVWAKKLKKFRLQHAVFIHGNNSVLKIICLHFEKVEDPYKIQLLLEKLKDNSNMLRDFGMGFLKQPKYQKPKIFFHGAA